MCRIRIPAKHPVVHGPELYLPQPRMVGGNVVEEVIEEMVPESERYPTQQLSGPPFNIWRLVKKENGLVQGNQGNSAVGVA